MKKKPKLESGWKALKSGSNKDENNLKKTSPVDSWAQKKLVKRYQRRFKLWEWIVKIIISFSLSFVISKAKVKDSRKKNELVNKIYKSITSHEFSFIPTSTAFYLFLSFIPILTISFSILSLSSESNYPSFIRDEVLARFIPGLGATIEQAIKILNFSNPVNNFGFVLIIITLVWISSNGYSKLIYSMSHIYKHENFGNPIVNRIKAIFMVIFITFYLTAILFIIAPYVSFLKANLVNNVAYVAVFYFSLFVFLTFFYYLGYLLLFKFTPKFKLKWSQIQPGLFITCVPTILITIVYGSFTNISFLGDLGVLATIIFITTFTLLVAYFTYVGIIANEAYYKTFHDLRTVDKYQKMASLFKSSKA